MLLSHPPLIHERRNKAPFFMENGKTTLKDILLGYVLVIFNE